MVQSVSMFISNSNEEKLMENKIQCQCDFYDPLFITRFNNAEI